jgi:hypothetical protein
MPVTVSNRGSISRFTQFFCLTNASISLTRRLTCGRGTDTNMTIQTPRPENSWALLTTGLLGPALFVRLRRA